MVLITACCRQLLFKLTVFLSVFAAVWSWTSSFRRTSCSHWWRGFAQRRTATFPLCLTPRRPSPPPQNASPKLTPRSTLAGNFGSYEKTQDRLLRRATDAQDLRIRPVVHTCLVYPPSSDLSPSTFSSLLDTEPLLEADRMCNGTQLWIPWKIQNVMLTKNGFRVIFELISSNRVWNYTRATYLGISKVRRRIWFPSVYLHIFF